MVAFICLPACPQRLEAQVDKNMSNLEVAYILFLSIDYIHIFTPALSPPIVFSSFVLQSVFKLWFQYFNLLPEVKKSINVKNVHF